MRHKRKKHRSLSVLERKMKNGTITLAEMRAIKALGRRVHGHEEHLKRKGRKKPARRKKPAKRKGRR